TFARCPHEPLRLSLDKSTETEYRHGLMGDPTPLLTALDGAGYRLTDARRAVAGLIADREGPFTAADILADAGSRRLGIGRATVFRAIGAFSTLRVAEQMELAHR